MILGVNKVFLGRILVCVFLCFFCAGNIFALDIERRWSKDELERRVFRIEVEGSMGVAFFISKQGHAITAKHLFVEKVLNKIKDGTPIKVRLLRFNGDIQANSWNTMYLRDFYISEDSDVALFRVSSEASGSVVNLDDFFCLGDVKPKEGDKFTIATAIFDQTPTAQDSVDARLSFVQDDSVTFQNDFYQLAGMGSGAKSEVLWHVTTPNIQFERGSSGGVVLFRGFPIGVIKGHKAIKNEYPQVNIAMPDSNFSFVAPLEKAIDLNGHFKKYYCDPVGISEVSASVEVMMTSSDNLEYYSYRHPDLYLGIKVGDQFLNDAEKAIKYKYGDTSEKPPVVLNGKYVHWTSQSTESEDSFIDIDDTLTKGLVVYGDSSVKYKIKTNNVLNSMPIKMRLYGREAVSAHYMADARKKDGTYGCSESGGHDEIVRLFDKGVYNFKEWGDAESWPDVNSLNDYNDSANKILKLVKEKVDYQARCKKFCDAADGFGYILNLSYDFMKRGIKSWGSEDMYSTYLQNYSSYTAQCAKSVPTRLRDFAEILKSQEDGFQPTLSEPVRNEILRDALNMTFESVGEKELNNRVLEKAPSSIDRETWSAIVDFSNEPIFVGGNIDFKDSFRREIIQINERFVQ